MREKFLIRTRLIDSVGKLNLEGVVLKMSIFFRCTLLLNAKNFFKYTFSKRNSPEYGARNIRTCSPFLKRAFLGPLNLSFEEIVAH
jgi:hypothetical protein